MHPLLALRRISVARLGRRMIATLGLVAVALTVGVPLAPAHLATVFVERMPIARAAPVIDGVCGSSEYSGANSFYLTYRPAFNFPPARVRVIADSTNLYVCASGLPRTVGTSNPTVEMLIDGSHAGGSIPAAGDTRITLDPTGAMRVSVADGSGGWADGGCICTGVTNTSEETTWTAEFSLDKSMFDNGLPGTVSGFSFRNDDFPTPGVDHTWPPTAQPNNPDSWGDLFWFGLPSVPDVQMNLSRVIQGAQTDVTAGVTDQLVADKSAFVETQLSNEGSPVSITSASCTFTNPHGTPFTVTATRLPNPLNTVPYPFFNGASQVDCFLPSSEIQVPGTYHLQMQAVQSDSAHDTFDLGTFALLPSGAERVLLWPAQFPTDSSRFATFNLAMTRAGIGLLNTVDRIWPLPNGLGPANENGRTLMTAGLRFAVNPTIWQCPMGTVLRRGPGVIATTCEDLEYQQANYDLQYRNSDLFLDEMVDQLPRDLFDNAATETATPQTSGGMSCWIVLGLRNALGASFNEIDTRLDTPAGVVLTQELAHCWGELEHLGSIHDPDRILTNEWHSRNHNVPLVRPDLMPVNLDTDTLLPDAESEMYPSFGQADVSSNYVLEGFAWNDLRSQLAEPGRVPSTSVMIPLVPNANQSRFVFTGSINDQGVVMPTMSETLTDAGLDQTPKQANSPYSLVFLDSKGGTLSSLPFGVSFQTTHEGVVSTDPLLLIKQPPAGTASVQIQDAGKVLWDQPVSASTPQVSSVQAAKDKNGNIDVSWSAADGDGDPLAYNLYLVSTKGADPIPIQIGVTGTSFSYNPALAPAGKDESIMVEATDGWNASSALSNTFTVAERAPIVGITAPTPTEQLIAGQSLQLSGWAYDYDTGAITDGTSYTWSSSLGGTLGSGNQLEATLAAGVQTLKLTAVGSNGKTGVVTMKVDVLADSDGDGMPDVYEAAHKCLNAKVNDAGADPDDDGLLNITEMQLGSNPCVADTDKDGVLDGAEVEFGTSPTDAKSVPSTPAGFVSTDDVDLGTCQGSLSGSFAISTLKAGTAWTVIPDSTQPWLSVSPVTGKGSAGVKLTADCSDLPAGASNVAHLFVVFTNHTYQVDVHLTS